MSDLSGSPDLTHQIAQPINPELKPAEKLPVWMRPTKWKILWLIGVLGFIWWTTSIFWGHEEVLYFSPQTLVLNRQTRINLLGTNIPVFVSEMETDDRCFLISDFLVTQGLWQPSNEDVEWWEVYREYGNAEHKWFFEDFAQDYRVLLGWTATRQGSQGSHAETPAEFWNEVLLFMRSKQRNRFDLARATMNRKRLEFTEPVLSRYEEEAMDLDVVYYLQKNRKIQYGRRK